jgi:hypothetical protein
MGAGRHDEIDLAAFLPRRADPPAGLPAVPPALRTAARRPADGDRTLVLDAGGENVIVVLAEDGADAGQIWDFIRHRQTGRNTARM